mgnify:CR=1 FL=1
MKIILRKIEPYENAKFSQTLKRHIDYTRVLLEITKKILYNGDSIDKVSLSSQAYLKLIIDKQSRIFVYLSTDKFYSFEYPCQVEIDKYSNLVNSIYTTSGINCTYELISNAISILDDVKCDSIIDVYESRDEENALLNIEAYKLLEYFWAHEPCYLRYDYDPKSSNGALHPKNHLDVNMSLRGSYKLGLKSKLSPFEFENIVSKTTDCYYLLDKIPSRLLELKDYKNRKKRSKRK